MGRRSLPIIPGMRFVRLEVIKRLKKPSQQREVMWECRCDCGNLVQVRASALFRGNTQSCGCLGRERSAQRTAILNYLHEDAGSPISRCWSGIRQRCLSPKHIGFKDYGSRGITMWPEWIDNYPVFRDYVLHNIGPRPSPKYSIDRRDNEGNYEPGNLKWSTRSEQMLNSRQASKRTKFLNRLVWDEML